MNQQLDILLLGKGARESAIAWKILKSPRCASLHTAPAALNGTVHAKGVKPMDFESVKEYVTANKIDMVIVGPENPIVAGIADYLAPYVKVIAPNAACARLEGSKEFAKEFLYENAIPTARFMPVNADTIEEGFAFLDSLTPPYVLKADGLAAGKGVMIVDELIDAKRTLHEMLNGMFGDASETVVIEEFLKGEECSVFVAMDGEDYKILPVARDYKRWGEGDTGLNTGGMGAISPVEFADDAFMEKVEKRIIIPTMRGLRKAEMEYRGFLFLGLINVSGEPMVIEYNVRLGDPETSVVMPRLDCDLISLMEGIADQTLALKKISALPEACASVVVTAPGYPADPKTGAVIEGLADGPLGAMHVIGEEDSLVFGAGINEKEGVLTTAGGRVAAAVACGGNVLEAVDKALATAGKIKYEGRYYRKDIGRTGK